MSIILSKNDKSLELRVRGFYLYDKGENDELFDEISSTTDLQVYFNMYL